MLPLAYSKQAGLLQLPTVPAEHAQLLVACLQSALGWQLHAVSKQEGTLDGQLRYDVLLSRNALKWSAAEEPC